MNQNINSITQVIDAVWALFKNLDSSGGSSGSVSVWLKKY
jgi:hypothetical protein